jgi:dimethylargininase
VAAAAIDLALAERQHEGYCRLLAECGAEVRTLTVNRDLPDSVFIEDTAVVLDELAVLTSMGTTVRRAELAGIEQELRQYRPVYRVSLPAKLEGGDVLRVGRTLLVGLSARTDAAGVEALANAVRSHGYEVRPVPLKNCLHLKTACTALPDGTLLLNPAWVDGYALDEYDRINVPTDDPFGANVLTLGERVCVAAEHEPTARLLEQHGYEVHTTALSEFAKAEGAVTCLSLVFRT